MNASPPERDRSRRSWAPPPDTDLIGVPLLIGLLVAFLAIAAAFVFIGGLGGIITVLVVLLVALAVSYRVVMDSDVED